MSWPEDAAPERADLILDGVADLVVGLELDGRITYANRACERILGVPTSHMLGHSFLEGIPSEDHARAIAVFRKVVETGEDRSVLFQAVRPDGVRIALDTSLRSSARRPGRPAIIAVCRDVTQQASAGDLEALRNARYRSLVESGLEATAVARADGVILYANRRFRALFDGATSIEALLPVASFGQRQALANAWFESTREEGSGTGRVDLERWVVTDERGSTESRSDEGRPARGRRATEWLTLHWNGFQSERGERLFALQASPSGPRKQTELAFTRLARGVDLADAEATQELLAALARALGLDRLILGQCDATQPDQLEVLAGWQDGGPIEPVTMRVDGLPESTAALGPLCIHPAGVPLLLPAVAERLGARFESFAGIGLDGGPDASGVLAGYARRALADPERVRDLLASAAPSFARALARRAASGAVAPASRYALLLRHTDDFVLELDAQGRIVACSDAVAALLPAPRPAAEDRLTDLFSEASARTCLTRLADPERDPDASGAPLELELRARDGGLRRIEARLLPLESTEGAARALLVGVDALRSTPPEVGSELLHRVIEESADLVFVCDLDTTILFANEAVTRRLPLAGGGRLVGRPLLELLTPSDAGRLRAEILPHLAPGLPWRGELALMASPETLEAPNATPGPVASTAAGGLVRGAAGAAGSPAIGAAASGTWWEDRNGASPSPGNVVEEEGGPIPTEATIQLVRDGPAAGRRAAPRAPRAHLAVTLRDVGARRRIEAALRESEARLARARKMESVGRLAGGIAHDFNNLLTAIIGYSDLVLQELAADHAARPDIEEILRAAERAGGLTRQLLAFSRRQVLRPERVDLNAVVADTDRMLRRLIGEDIELVTELDGGLDPILADPGQVEQVIVNLVVNARDAMPRGGRLELETANFVCRAPQPVESGLLAPGSYVTLRVSDTGIGMDEATRAQIFEPFFTTKSAAGGTGLGLASVYGIVSQSRGQIAVESRLGQGSTFTVYLPTANEELVGSAPEEPLVSAGRGRETVLLVEDSRSVLRLIERTLHRRGYSVLPAESATAALRQCSRHDGPIDLLLTDVVLPRMSGPEIAERVRQLRPGIRVLYMSGFTDETLSQHDLARADDRLLQKPFSSATLLSRVRRALDEDAQQATFPVEHHEQDRPVTAVREKNVSD